MAARPPLAYLSEITPQYTLPAFAAYGDAYRTPEPRRFTADDWRDADTMRGRLATAGEQYLGMSPQQANVVFGAGAEPPMMSLADLVPGLGTGLAVGDVRQSLAEGDYVGASLNALGAIPMAAAGAKLAKGAIKGGKAATVGALAALGLEMTPEEAEAAWLTDIPKGLITKFGDVKQRRPLSEVAVDTAVARPTLPFKPVDIADLQGSHVVAALGDPSVAGIDVRGLGGRKFEMPVGTYGGGRFAADKTLNPDEIWASKSGAAKTLQDAIDVAGAKGDPVNLMTWHMGPHSGDSNTMSASVIRELMRDHPFTQAQLDAINDAVKAKSRTFPGIENITDEWMKSAPGTARAEIMKMLDKAPQMRAGFPSAAEIRFGLSEPELRNAAIGDMGFMIGRARPGAALVRASETATPHPTYNTKIRGDLVGQLEGPLSYRDLMRDWMKTRPAAEQAGQNYGHTARAALTQAPTQYIDQEIVDRVSDIFRRRRQEGL